MTKNHYDRFLETHATEIDALRNMPGIDPLAHLARREKAPRFPLQGYVLYAHLIPQGNCASFRMAEYRGALTLDDERTYSSLWTARGVVSEQAVTTALVNPRPVDRGFFYAYSIEHHVDYAEVFTLPGGGLVMYETGPKVNDSPLKDELRFGSQDPPSTYDCHIIVTRIAETTEELPAILGPLATAIGLEQPDAEAMTELTLEAYATLDEAFARYDERLAQGIGEAGITGTAYIY